MLLLNIIPRLSESESGSGFLSFASYSTACHSHRPVLSFQSLILPCSESHCTASSLDTVYLSRVEDETDEQSG